MDAAQSPRTRTTLRALALWALAPTVPAAAAERSLDEVLELHATAVLPAATFDGAREELGERVWTQPAVGLRATVHPIENSYIRFTTLFYPIPTLREGWTPDFVYSVGYGDWRPRHAFFDHSNYTGSRWPWREGSPPAVHWALGLNTVGWRYALPAGAMKALHAPEQLWLGGAAMAHYALAYGKIDGTEGQHLLAFSNNLALSWREHVFAEFRGYWYPIAEQQQVWDPDYTWSVGWMDWRPWSLSVRWSNYAGNRWAGHGLEGNGGLGTGALFIDFKAGLQAGPRASSSRRASTPR
jgi:hypothetical protein